MSLSVSDPSRDIASTKAEEEFKNVEGAWNKEGMDMEPAFLHCQIRMVKLETTLTIGARGLGVEASLGCRRVLLVLS